MSCVVLGRLLNLSWMSHPGLSEPEEQCPAVNLPLSLAQHSEVGEIAGPPWQTLLSCLLILLLSLSFVTETTTKSFLQLNHNTLDNERQLEV